MKTLSERLQSELEPGSQLKKDYMEHVRRSEVDTSSRAVSALLSTLLVAWLTSALFAAIWLSMIFVNEYFVVRIRNRINHQGYANGWSVFWSTVNIFYGTVAWCIATIYMSMTGGIGEILFGVCIIVGVLTYSSFSKVSYENAVWAAVTPVAMTLICVPVITFMRGLSDIQSTLAIVLAFCVVLYYFITAIRHNFAVRDELIGTLHGLSAANIDLEQHRLHLSELVDERTRELNEEKIKLQQSLDHEKQLNEMQAQFVSMASHEFRTPLAIIDGSARRIDRMLKRQELEKISERSETIRASVQRLTVLIERTLDSSRLASGKLSLNKTDFNIRDQLIDILQRQKEVYPKHKVTTDLTDCPPSFRGDESLIDTALSNVISNAMKYSKDNPQIGVQTRTTDEMLEIRVCDRGIGIPRKELSDITTRFFRSSNVAGIPGTGIGLNLVRTLIEMHGGRFEIDSREGEWTEVTLYLPLEAEVPDTDTEAA